MIALAFLQLLFYTLWAFGLCYVVGHARISLRLRERLAETRLRWFVELVECPACLGFWVGLAFGFYHPSLVPLDVPAVPLFLAFYTSATGYLLGRATGWLQE